MSISPQILYYLGRTVKRLFTIDHPVLLEQLLVFLLAEQLFFPQGGVLANGICASACNIFIALLRLIR